MTDTSGEINLQSKQDIIYHVGEVKPAIACEQAPSEVGKKFGE